MSLGEAIKTVITDGPEDINGKDIGIFATIQRYFMDFVSTMKQQGYAYNVFEKNLFFLKAFGLIAILMLAIVNYSMTKNAGMISSQPLVFFKESLLFAVGGLVPFLIVAYLRNNVYSNKELLMMSFVIFGLMFILNYLMELSGFYSWTFNYKPKPQLKENETNDFPVVVSRSSEYMLVGIIAGAFFAMLFSSLFVMNTNPMYVHGNIISPIIIFLMEMILFGVISAVPVYLMASNRDDLSSQTSIEFLVIFLKFAFLHCLLQISGFYKHAFNPKE